VITKLIHTLFPDKCIKHMKQQTPSTKNQRMYIGINAEMICSKCGREIAFKWGEYGAKLFVHLPFEKHEDEVRTKSFEIM